MDIFNQVHDDSLILTPNRRLSAVLSRKYSEWQTTQQKKCWPTLKILPFYPTWLEKIWQEYAARELNDCTFLLSSQHERILWEKILRDSPLNETLLQLTDTAKLSKSAWETLKRWRVSLDDPNLALTEDSRAFLEWALQFKKILQKNNWLDQNSLADVIAEKIKKKKIIPAKQIILFGFTDIAPQYQYLLNCCEAAGTEIIHANMTSINEKAHKIGLQDAEAEIHAMARWAKALAPECESIGCIVPDLHVLRDKIIRIFSEVFESPDFNISAGKSLTTYPIIHDALQLLKLSRKALPLPTISQLLRSPFVAGAETERFQRAIFDARLHSSNVTLVSLSQLVDAEYPFNLNESCPQLAEIIKKFLGPEIDLKEKKPASHWVKVICDQLVLWGWPGERSMNSHEYQVVHHSWLPLLTEYASFDMILGALSFNESLHYLITLASNIVFQPESPQTRVQILGMLEAAEIPFERSWVMGLDDISWPARPKPNPFIPLRLQKNLLMPNASASRELIYCEKLTQQLEQSAKEIIFSYPNHIEDRELFQSALLKKYPDMTLDSLPQSAYTKVAVSVFKSQKLESIEDYQAPAILPDEEVHGGVRIFKNQAECPFKAFAEIRLHAKKWEDTTLGLRKLDRGNLIHKALELIWRELRNSEKLLLIPDATLKELIRQSADTALKTIGASIKSHNTRYLALELQRSEKIIWDWLQIEKSRPGFSVVALEQEISATIGRVKTQFRVDRIDELTENTAEKQLIIDYKTGKAIDKKNWFGERLEEPQLPIYCIANPDKTIGIAFAKINPTKMEMTGVSKSPLKIKSVYPLADLKYADATLWTEQMRLWQKNLSELADRFYQGEASVSPKDPNKTCTHCDLKSFCRIYELTQLEEDDDETHEFTGQ